MKIRKLILGIILFLIAGLLGFMYYVMSTGSYLYKEEKNYIMALENAACDYVQSENVTEAIWKDNTKWQKISIKKLLSTKFLSEDLKNPITQKSVSEYKNEYINIEFKKSKMYCKYKED